MCTSYTTKFKWENIFMYRFLKEMRKCQPIIFVGIFLLLDTFIEFEIRMFICLDNRNYCEDIWIDHCFGFKRFDSVFGIHLFYVFMFIAEEVVLTTFDYGHKRVCLIVTFACIAHQLFIYCFHSEDRKKTWENRKSLQFWVIWKIVLLSACRQLRRAVQILCGCQLLF